MTFLNLIPVVEFLCILPGEKTEGDGLGGRVMDKWESII